MNLKLKHSDYTIEFVNTCRKFDYPSYVMITNFDNKIQELLIS